MVVILLVGELNSNHKRYLKNYITNKKNLGKSLAELEQMNNSQPETN